MIGASDVSDGRTRELLRRLELDVTVRLDGLLHGDHRGLVPGHGTELGETRRYAPGDDVRRIDWNVTARLSEPYIRQTIADRELETWILADRSPRLDFGTANVEKRDLVLAGTAAVGFLTNRDGNRIGAVLAGQRQSDLIEHKGRPPRGQHISDDRNGGHTVIPAKGTRRHLLHILHSLASSPRHDSGGVTDLAGALHRVNGIAKRRGLLAVVSDFRVGAGWEDALAIAAVRHDVLAIEVSDPREAELPNVGLLTVVDPGTGQLRELATNKASVRQAYADAAAAHHEHLAATFRKHRIEHLRLSTDRAWLDDVVSFMANRRLRMNAPGARR
ncbi:MAG: DUF58 domain-containing protein [Acidimicrobiales bacterium]